ncbi:MAG: oligosaccharide flippase family protein [Clostridia bacterium]|nr:oligosaccharide flippase family protein [Clostridia bacterium]
MAEKKEKSFLNDFFTLGVGTFLYLLVGVIGTPIITRLVDPIDYGKMSMITVYSGIGVLVCGLGLDQALARFFYQEENVDFKRKLLQFCCAIPLMFTAALGVLLFVFRNLSSALGYEMISLTELILLILNVVAQLLHRYGMLVLRLRYSTKMHSVVNIIQKASYIIVTVLFVCSTNIDHFLILAVSTIFSSFFAFFVEAIHERDVWKPVPVSSKPSLNKSELLKYSIPLMFSGGISMLFNSLDRLAINHFCTLSDVGVYASAMNLMAVFSVIKTSFNAIWMPSAVKHYEEKPEDKRFYQQGNAFISALMIIFGAAVVLFKDLFVLLLGAEYHEASKIIPFLMFEPIMYTVSETTATGIVVQKKSAYQLAVAGISCLINFIGNTMLTPLLGPQGAAISTGISYIVFFALRTHLANKVFYVDYKLSRFGASTIALLIFAIYGSFHSFSIIQVAMFLAVTVITLLSYREYIPFAIRYGKQIVNKLLKKKN